MVFDIKKIATYLGHRDSVYSIGPGIQEGKMMSGSGDGYLVEWNSPEEGIPFAKVNHPIYAFAQVPKEKTLWLAENSVGIHQINTDSKKVVNTYALGKSSLFFVQIFGDRIFMGDNHGYLHVLQNGTFTQHQAVSTKSLRTLAINEARGEMAVGSSDHSIYILDLDTLQPIKKVEGHLNSVFTLCYHGHFLISAGRDARIRLWDSSLDYLPVTEIPAHNYTIHHLLPVEEYGLLASCSMDKSIKIWDLEDMRLLKVIDKGKFASHGTSVNRLWWNRASQSLFSASDDRTISEWKLF